MHLEISNLLNQQLNKELYSAYLYLNIANYYADQGLNGFEHWFYIQTQEERDHAMLFRAFLLNNEANIHLLALPAPEQIFADYKAPLEAALEHEKYITKSIHDIYDKAYETKEFRVVQFLDWFIKEQGEEEKNTGDLVKRFDLFGGDTKGLYLLDSELSSRVYSAPSIVQSNL